MNPEQIRNLIESDRKHKAYMQAYNQRPEVKEKRKQYNKARWAMIQMAREIAKDEQV